MIPQTKKIVTDEQNRLVAVLIDYPDWEKIEQLLVTHQSKVEAISDSKTPQIEVNFTIQVRDIPDAHRQEAESKAKEAYVMTLLRHGDISTGRAAEILGIPRVDLFDLMGEYGISVFPDYTAEELEREVNETARMLEQYKQ
jgi:predicted HTH domain antitoxin